MKNWIKENLKLYKGLTPGKIYIVFENEKPALWEVGMYIRRTNIPEIQPDGSKKFKNVRISENRNLYICKIAICPDCGKKRADIKLRSSLCDKCQKKAQSKDMLRRYYEKKANNGKLIAKKELLSKSVKPKTAKQIAFEITGEYKRVATHPETIKRLMYYNQKGENHERTL